MSLKILFAEHSGAIRERLVELDEEGMVDFKSLCTATVHHPSCVFKFLTRLGLVERFELAKSPRAGWRLPAHQAQRLVLSLVGMEEARRGIPLNWRLMSPQDITSCLLQHGAGRPGPQCQCGNCLFARAMWRRRFDTEHPELPR